MSFKIALRHVAQNRFSFQMAGELRHSFPVRPSCDLE